MTHNPKHASLEAENAELRRLLERVLMKEAMFGKTDARLSIDIRNEIYPGWNDEPEDEGDEPAGKSWAQEHRLTAHDYGLK